MQATMQTVQQVRRAPQITKPPHACPDALDLLEQFGSTVVIRHSNEIYAQSDPTEFCWRILSGCVRTVKLMEDGRRQIGAFLWSGDLVGMDDLGTHDFGAEAVTDVTMRRYPRRMVEALAKSHPALALRLRTLAVANLHRAYRQITLLGRMTAMERVASFLLEIDRHSTATDHRIVDVPMTRTDIADHLGTTIETVCRNLACLQRGGTIAILRSGIELRDRVALLKLACESRY